MELEAALAREIGSKQSVNIVALAKRSGKPGVMKGLIKKLLAIKTRLWKSPKGGLKLSSRGRFRESAHPKKGMIGIVIVVVLVLSLWWIDYHGKKRSLNQPEIGQTKGGKAAVRRQLASSAVDRSQRQESNQSLSSATLSMDFTNE